jgi:enoyl-CoA hydratase
VILTGDPLPAQRAYDLGLVNRLVEPGKAVETAVELAKKIATSAPLAVWASRKIVLASAYETDENLISMTNQEFGAVLKSEDTKEGLTAFIEKRPPQWKGR